MELTDTKPRHLLGDRAYDSDDIRSALLLHGIRPVIPARSNRKDPPKHDRALYKERNRIERLVGRLKECRRIATRYEKTADSFHGMLNLAAIRLWIEFFNRR